MSESVEYFKEKLQTVIQYYHDLKSGKIAKEHSFSLSYGKKRS